MPFGTPTRLAEQGVRCLLAAGGTQEMRKGLAFGIGLVPREKAAGLGIERDDTHILVEQNMWAAYLIQNRPGQRLLALWNRNACVKGHRGCQVVIPLPFTAARS